jgi:hypothetical protein
MKNIGFGLSVLRPLRFIIVAISCAILFFSNAFPAAAVSAPQSNAEDATTQLLETQKKTDEISTQPPPGLEKQVEETKGGGLNVVQGTADVEKMKRPENSQQAITVEEQVKNLLDKVTGNQ